MSDPFSQIAAELMQNNPQITAIAVARNDGSVVWQTSNWNIVADVPQILQVQRTKGNSITVQGIKYSTISATPDRLVTTNVGGQGHIIVAKAGNNGWVIAYAVPDADHSMAYFDVARAAAKFGQII